MADDGFAWFSGTWVTDNELSASLNEIPRDSKSPAVRIRISDGVISALHPDDTEIVAVFSIRPAQDEGFELVAYSEGESEGSAAMVHKKGPDSFCAEFYPTWDDRSSRYVYMSERYECFTRYAEVSDQGEQRDDDA